MEGFKDLIVWQKSHNLVLFIYKETKDFPDEERFGITQQARRCAVSIAANIAEGAKRRTKKDFCHFLNMAEGSLEELKYYLILSEDLGYLSRVVFNQIFSLSEEVGKILNGLIRRLRAV